jgi:hypothetical protein
MAGREVNRMSEHDEHGMPTEDDQEERPHATEPNPTQQRIDEQPDTDKPVALPVEGEREEH